MGTLEYSFTVKEAHAHNDTTPPSPPPPKRFGYERKIYQALNSPTLRMIACSVKSSFRFFELRRALFKKYKYDKKFVSHENSIWVSKNAKFYADFDTLRKLQKRL